MRALLDREVMVVRGLKPLAMLFPEVMEVQVVQEIPQEHRAIRAIQGLLLQCLGQIIPVAREGREELRVMREARATPDFLAPQIMMGQREAEQG